MQWRARAGSSRAKERANISFFIFIMFFAVFGIIILTELLPLDRPNQPARSHYDDLQHWSAKAVKSASEATEPTPPAKVPQDGVWQPVGGTRFKFFVYSAYVERRTVGAVRVIAATKTRGADSVVCRLWLPNNRTVTLKAKVQAIRENWNMKYSAVYVLCLLRDSGVKPRDTAGASIAVLSSFAVNRQATNMLLVKHTEPDDGIQVQDELHVCVKPFHFLYHHEWLLEWMEMNRLLGVNHFYMYNKSVSPRVGCVLNHYKQQGLITLLPWKLPLLSQVDIRTEGLFAAFNDCLYRSMSTAGWLLPIDTDELVLPMRAPSIPAMLNNLTQAKLPSKKPAAFLFRNAFFYTRWEDDPEAPASLVTARKTRRLKTPHALKNRSKYVVRPRDVVELGNHFVWEHAPGATSLGVPAEIALLHHYRENCEYDGVQCLKLPSIVDRTAHKWSKELLERVEAERHKMIEVC